MAFERIAFVAGPMPEAQAGLRRLVHKYGNSDIAHADVVVALGGDGFMLQTLHRMIGTTVPIYGMNRGTVGFLMNDYEETDLLERINGAEPAQIHPLQMVATDDVGIEHGAIAINEVSLLRETRQTAKIRIIIDGKTRMEELICDGILVATPAGSTAYNLSAHGPVLPIDSRLLAITPISAFRPRRWRGALIDHRSEVVFEVLESAKRPVSAVADHVEVRNVVRVKVAEAVQFTITMLFDDGHSLKERILTEQFFH